jgi:hypothetical protein
MKNRGKEEKPAQAISVKIENIIKILNKFT